MLSREAQKIAKELGIKINFPILFGFFLNEGELTWTAKGNEIKIISIKIDKSDLKIAKKALRHEIRHVWQIRSKIFNPVDRTWLNVVDSSLYGAEKWELDAKEFSNK